MRRCTTLRFVLTDHPWKIDPIQADRSYTPWDRRLDKVKAMISRLQYAVGVTARKSSTSLVSPIQDDHAALTQDKAAMTTGQDNATANTDLIAMKTGFQTPESFSINTDQIIGGHTEAFVDATEDDTFLFHGTLRVTRDPLRMSTAIGFDTITDEHVGFATMEYDFPGFYRIESRTARAFEVRVRGSGHPFFMKFQTSWGKDFQYFAHMFVPTDEWRVCQWNGGGGTAEDRGPGLFSAVGGGWGLVITSTMTGQPDKMYCAQDLRFCVLETQKKT